MTKPQTVLELARHDAQDLHKKISGNIAKAEQATWADVKAVQADLTALATRMKTLAEDQADAVKSGIKAAVAKMDAAAKLVEGKAVAGVVAAKDGVKHANAAMLDSVHNAANSLSAAVAAARTKLAKAIAPKQVVAWNTYIAVVFASDDKAHQALQKLWHMDDEGLLTVHGAAVVRRDDLGHIRVTDRDSDLGLRTAIGVGVGALLGLLAGPVGVAAGVAGAAALSVGAATGAGALAGAAVGATADVVVETRRENAAYESFFTLKHGQSAVLAEISEDWTQGLDDAMHPMGGTIYRRRNNAATNAAFGENYCTGYLYPYYHPPMHL